MKTFALCNRLNPEEWDRFAQATAIVPSAKISIDDTAALSVPEFLAKARRLKRDKQVEWLF
jgi:replicative DNA helicase